MSDGQVIVVLGAPNSDDGVLSEIARSRCDGAARLYHKRPSRRLVLTGGFGEHFNRTEHPHTTYLRAYLLDERAVPPDAILACVASANTLEDARGVRSVCAEGWARKLIVVTSDFHAERARLLFEREFGEAIEVRGVPTNLDAGELERLRRHERQAIERLG